MSHALQEERQRSFNLTREGQEVGREMEELKVKFGNWAASERSTTWELFLVANGKNKPEDLQTLLFFRFSTNLIKGFIGKIVAPSQGLNMFSYWQPK